MKKKISAKKLFVFLQADQIDRFAFYIIFSLLTAVRIAQKKPETQVSGFFIFVIVKSSVQSKNPYGVANLRF